MLPPSPQAYTRSLAYDPETAYLASVNADGTLNVWAVNDGRSQLCRRKACPKARAGWRRARLPLLHGCRSCTP